MGRGPSFGELRAACAQSKAASARVGGAAPFDWAQGAPSGVEGRGRSPRI
jgi:hypothetical protein